MDTGRAAKFPFLRESAEFAEQNNADLEALLTSPSYEPARDRGVRRVMDALENSEVTYTPLMSDYDRLIEVMSYPFARMVVSMIGDRFLTKRYALAEAVRMNKILSGEDRETLLIVSEELGVTSTVDADGIIRMKFPDYLRLANRLKSVDWKLINCDIHSGLVYLPQEKFSRLMQNALQDKIESELPLMTPEEYRKYLRGPVDAVSMALEETKAKYSPTGGEGMKNEFLPPCLVHILDMSRRGMNLPHSARFALVTFLHALGLDYDGIIRVFSESPDFSEEIAGYQIKHITGELSGTEGYSPPECKTMKTNGLCYNPDTLCQQEWMNHPLTYYRVKSRDRKESPGTGRRDRAANRLSRRGLTAKHHNKIIPNATMDRYGSSDADSANMAPDNYIPRISDIQLRKELAATGAVLIVGPGDVKPACVADVRSSPIRHRAHERVPRRSNRRGQSG